MTPRRCWVACSGSSHVLELPDEGVRFQVAYDCGVQPVAGGFDPLVDLAAVRIVQGELGFVEGVRCLLAVPEGPACSCGWSPTRSRSLPWFLSCLCLGYHQGRAFSGTAEGTQGAVDRHLRPAPPPRHCAARTNASEPEKR